MKNFLSMLIIFLLVDRGIPLIIGAYNNKAIDLSFSGNYYRLYKIISFPRTILGISFCFLIGVGSTISSVKENMIFILITLFFGISYFAFAYTDAARAAE